VITLNIALLPANRPDGLAIAFGAASLMAVSEWEDARRPRALILGALAAIGMIIVKYNFAPLAAASLVAIFLRDRRAAMQFGAIVAFGSILLFSIAQVASSGAFVDNMRDFGGNGYSWAALREVLDNALLPFPNPILAVAAIEAAIGVYVWRAARSATLLWFGSFAVLATAIKIGSALNYWLPVFFASAVLLGPALRRLRLAGGPATAAAVTVGIALMLLPSTINLVTFAARTPTRLSGLQNANEDAVARITALGGRLLADRNDLAIESGHRPTYDPAFAVLAASGKWDPRGLASEVRRRHFGAIQSRFDLQSGPIPGHQGIPVWPEAVVQAIRSSYCLAWKSPRVASEAIWIYRPCRSRRTNPP
jgi:hypothetical protein